MKLNLLHGLLAVILSLANYQVLAEDIDLFVGAPPGSSGVPNVLIVLDNGANFSASALTCEVDEYGSDPKKKISLTLNGTSGGIEQCALYSVIAGLDTSDGARVKLGFMVFNDKGITDWEKANCDSQIGGCLVVPILEVTEDNKKLLLEWITTWKTDSKVKTGFQIKASNQSTGAVMQEAWAYYAGRMGLSGRDYSSIQPGNVCGNNYIVFTGNSYNSSGTPGDQTGDKGPKGALEGTNTVALKNALRPATTDEKNLIAVTYTSPICLGSVTLPTIAHENKGYYADEWARYAANSMGITTYSIGVLSPECKGQVEYEALLDKMAAENVGNGKYYPTTSFEQLEFAFGAILSEVQAKESAFASVSLPVSVNTQGSYLNQIYIGMFRPDAKALPRWSGNLKQYKLGYSGVNLELQDAKSVGAISSGNTGFIAECAQSYWTPDSETPDTYWEKTPWTSKSPPYDANCSGFTGSSNTPDGNVVEKGAQGYVLRAASPADRKLYTCSNAGCTTTGLFNIGNAYVSDALLGVAAADRSALIDWARGLNNLGDEFGDPAVMRPSVHGDVVHSRPVAINYERGFDTSVPPKPLPPKVVVFYGGNDGVLRAVNGDRSATLTFGSTTVAAGAEMWGFVPPEFYPNFKRLRDNTSQIDFPHITGGAPKPYGFDGPIVGYLDTSNVYLYAGLRRGGNAIYAFDATDPVSPSLKWKFTDSSLAQTWSAPKVFTVNTGTDSVPVSSKPYLIFGGGYDLCEDYDADPAGANHNCTTPKGNRIYVLDATGTAPTVIKIFGVDNDPVVSEPSGAPSADVTIERSVVAEVTIVPDANGYAKYAYAADMGGNLYRLDIGDKNPDNWKITKIASLGCNTTAPCTANRKFMFAPDVVANSDGSYSLLIGSGEREKPLTIFKSAYAVNNYFFMVRDKPSDPEWLTDEKGAPNSCGQNLICFDSLYPIPASGSPAIELPYKGWRLEMAPHEQVVTSAITVYGVVTFSTHIPSVWTTNSCSNNLGIASVYNINYLNAASENGTDVRSETIAGGGLPPSPVAGQVILDDGTKVPFIIGASPKSPLEGKLPTAPASAKRPKTRAYWYIQK